ncbi:hypothetical protein RSAG8_09941, partial [Rhizoctonia solani AG-8 WAC10335]
MATAGTPLTYDFTPALTTLDPYHQYLTSPLSGGMVNLTVRVNISDTTEEHTCPFGGARSVVAKYAPGFVASVGESAPLSQYRQVIEARALALLSQLPVSAYIQSSNVNFPKLIHHDPGMNVLVMSGLGETGTLDKWLISGPDTGVATEVGRSFGEFLARLGSVSEDVNQGDNPPNLYEHFDNPSTHELIFDAVITPIESHLLKCGVFGIGDSWPRSYLIGEAGSKPQLSVVDWEFAGMTSPLIDLSQLCAHLYLLCQTSSTKIKPKIKAYTLAMVRAHRTYAPEWHYRNEYRADARTLFGREIINNTVEIDWWDGDKVKKQADMKVIGALGAAFIKEAGQRGSKGGPLLEDVFDAL